MALEVEADLSRYRAWRYVMSTVVRREEVVQSDLIRDVDHREPDAPLVAVGPAARKQKMTGTTPSNGRTNLIVFSPYECGRGALLRCGQE